MAKKADGQGDLVLENRQLLGIFFGIVALCGVFFALGYLVGRNTLSSSATATREESGSAESGAKPNPMPPAAYLNQPQPGSPAPPTETQPGTDLNFYQSVEEKTPEAKLVSPESAGASSSSPAATAQPSEPPKPADVPPPPPGILVQVSALTRQEDAQSLVQLLKEKKLPVLVTSGTNDSLYHVVVGPYKTDKEAQEVKRTLELDGFQPIIKK